MANNKIKPKFSNCVGCNGREYAIDSFYEKPSTFQDEFTNGYIPYCKKCCENILKYYINKTGTLQGAFYYTCAKLDVPYVKKPYMAMIKQKENLQNKSKNAKEDYEYNLFDWYYNFMWGHSKMMKPTDVWNGFIDSDMKVEDDKVTESKEAVKKEMDNYIKDWGNQDCMEDYEYLTYVYGKYTQDLEDITPQQDDLIRDLCLARLDKRKIDDGRSGEDVTKVQTRILTLMNKLKFDNFDSSRAKTQSELFIANKIALINENNVSDIYNNPCPNKDYNKLLKYVKDICLRPLGNMLAGNKDYNLDINDIQEYNLNDE